MNATLAPEGSEHDVLDNTNVHRGIHALSMRATEACEGARLRFLDIDEEGRLRGRSFNCNDEFCMLNVE